MVGLWTSTKNKIDSARICMGFKMDSLTHGIERACALYPGISGVSASSNGYYIIASFFS